jgi:hypothetical protein
MSLTNTTRPSSMVPAPMCHWLLENSSRSCCLPGDRFGCESHCRVGNALSFGDRVGTGTVATSPISSREGHVRLASARTSEPTCSRQRHVRFGAGQIVACMVGTFRSSSSHTDVRNMYLLLTRSSTDEARFPTEPMMPSSVTRRSSVRPVHPNFEKVSSPNEGQR